MKAYYGSRFSPNQTSTPEGFLICHNVPISRTGWYEYLGEEIGAQDQAGKVVKVYRSPEEVFKPAAMASFEGKILTDEHPPVPLTPDNATLYAKGAVQNVRQGSGEEIDLLIADLVVYDKALIDEIQEGKREVSAGYDLVYVDMGDGTYQQQQIVGNHVAVVKSGRAGDRVAIKDSKPNLPSKGETKMGKKYDLPQRKKSLMTDFLVAVGLKQIAMDSEPEKIAEAVDAIIEERGAATDEDTQEPQTPPQNPAPAKDEAQAPTVAPQDAKLDKLIALVTQLVTAEKKEASPEDAIDALISELEGQSNDDDEEESHTIPAESMDDEGPVSDPEDRPKNAIPGADNAYKLAALKAIKPMLAEITDPAAKKRATDAAIASIKGKSSKNTYAAINKAQKKVATDKQQTANDKQQQKDHSQLGMEIAKKHNPHYKNKA
jgi:hypothetical protein